MFFILSKILSFLVDPFIWVIIIFSISLLLKKIYKRKYYFLFGFFLLILFSNSFFYSLINSKWDIKSGEFEEYYDYGILMGGMIGLNSTSDNIQFLKNNDRLLNTIELYKKGKIKNILITGASGSLTSNMKESQLIKKFLLRIGIPKKRIIIEDKSMNTHENAIYCQKVIKQLHPDNNVRCLAITSSYHMRRTIACFDKTNIKVDPYVKNPSIKHFDLEKIIIPQSHILFKWKILLHEIFGYFTYKLMGYI